MNGTLQCLSLVREACEWQRRSVEQQSQIPLLPTPWCRKPLECQIYKESNRNVSKYFWTNEIE